MTGELDPRDPATWLWYRPWSEVDERFCRDPEFARRARFGNVRVRKRATSTDYDDSEDRANEKWLAEEVLPYWADDEIIVNLEDEIRDRWELPAGREVLLAWLAARRIESFYPNGPMTLEEQADELNGYTGRTESGDHWIAFDGELVVEGGIGHRELIRRRTSRWRAQLRTLRREFRRLPFARYSQRGSRPAARVAR